MQLSKADKKRKKIEIPGKEEGIPGYQKMVTERMPPLGEETYLELYKKRPTPRPGEPRTLDEELTFRSLMKPPGTETNPAGWGGGGQKMQRFTMQPFDTHRPFQFFPGTQVFDHQNGENAIVLASKGEFVNIFSMDGIKRTVGKIVLSAEMTNLRDLEKGQEFRIPGDEAILKIIEKEDEKIRFKSEEKDTIWMVPEGKEDMRVELVASLRIAQEPEVPGAPPISPPPLGEPMPTFEGPGAPEVTPMPPPGVPEKKVEDKTRDWTAMDREMLTKFEQDREDAIKMMDIPFFDNSNVQIRALMQKYKPLSEMTAQPIEPEGFIANEAKAMIAPRRNYSSLYKQGLKVLETLQNSYNIFISSIGVDKFEPTDDSIMPETGIVELTADVRKAGSKGKKLSFRISVGRENIQLMPFFFDSLGRKYRLSQEKLEKFIDDTEDIDSWVTKTYPNEP